MRSMSASAMHGPLQLPRCPCIPGPRADGRACATALAATVAPQLTCALALAQCAPQVVLADTLRVCTHGSKSQQGSPAGSPSKPPTSAWRCSRKTSTAKAEGGQVMIAHQQELPSGRCIRCDALGSTLNGSQHESDMAGGQPVAHVTEQFPPADAPAACHWDICPNHFDPCRPSVHRLDTQTDRTLRTWPQLGHMPQQLVHPRSQHHR